MPSNIDSKIFITGTTGFIGSHLVSELKKRNLPFVADSHLLYGDIAKQRNWGELLTGCSGIVHLADPLALSNVEETFDRPFSASDLPAPQDAYGISKMEAEAELLKLHETGVFEVVIIRSPLVYGPGVKANFEKLFYFVNRDLPIPFGLVKNKRSLVSVLNLVDLIITTLSHPKAGGEIFMASDDHDLSLRELIELMAQAQGKSAHLLPVPVGLMKFAAKILGKKSYADRLFGNLQVDIEKTKRVLDWIPPYTFEDTFRNDTF